MKRLLVIGLLLVGCGSPPPTSGYVVGQTYDDPDDWTVSVDDYRYECRYEFGYNPATGKYEAANICKDRLVGSHNEPRHDGPHWYLRVRDDKDRKHLGDVEVTEQVFNEHPVGVHWPDPR